MNIRAINWGLASNWIGFVCCILGIGWGVYQHNWVLLICMAVIFVINFRQIKFMFGVTK